MVSAVNPHLPLSLTDRDVRVKCIIPEECTSPRCYGKRTVHWQCYTRTGRIGNARYMGALAGEAAGRSLIYLWKSWTI